MKGDIPKHFVCISNHNIFIFSFILKFLYFFKIFCKILLTKNSLPWYMYNTNKTRYCGIEKDDTIYRELKEEHLR